MRPRKSAWTAWVFALALGSASVSAQTAAPTLAPGAEDALHALSQSAAVIFAGQVTAIRRHEGVDGATGVVEVDFAVEDAVRGVSSSTYTLREWAGLWAAGAEPFCVGRRYLMLLHAPGRAGLSSPVGGTDGAIPILGAASEVPPSAAQPVVAALPALTDGRVVDLRWVATRVARPVSYAVAPVARPISQPVALRPEARVAEVDLAATQSGATAQSGAPPLEGATYPAVLGLLRSWEKPDDAER